MNMTAHLERLLSWLHVGHKLAAEGLLALLDGLDLVARGEAVAQVVVLVHDRGQIIQALGLISSFAVSVKRLIIF